MASGCLNTRAALSTKVTGAAIKSMDWVKRLVKTAPRILATIRMETRKELASTSGKKEANTQDNGLTINCKDLEPTNGLTAVSSLANGTTG